LQLDENEFMVKTEVIRNDENSIIKVDYLVRDLIKGDKYNLKVSDIITEGVSMVNSHQDEFNSIITNNGFDALIIELKKKI
jgi:ABC-type transporter MlaC component